MKQNAPIRCPWCGSDEDYIRYHDKEWGKPTTDENVLFEFLILEGAQAGLSWITILRRRENYRKAFANFNPKIVARFEEVDITRLLNDPGIIRNKLKIKSVIKNASLFLSIQEEFGSFSTYLLSFFPNQKPIINHPTSITEIPVTSTISDHISQDMKKRGFTFFGSTICYSFLQATGYINDHIDSCEFK